MVIGFIGLGNMARAMIGGMLTNGLAAPEDIIGSAKTAKTMERAAEDFGIRTASNAETAKAADILVLAVKPQFFPEVLPELKAVMTPDKILISLAPGKTIAWLKEQLACSMPVARCMPNTPALVGAGTTGVCFDEKIGDEQKELVLKLVGSFGLAMEVPERLMDVVVGISGSSPAYVFMFMEAMADAAVAEGMPRALAYKMAAQAVMGSAKLMLDTGKHPGELKDMVCSPGGTTIQAVKALEEHNFRGTVMDAVCACIDKSRSL